MSGDTQATGKVFIERKNPDFVNCNGKKALIEYDEVYWHSMEHTKKEDVERNAIYAKYGYRLLSLNAEDLKTPELLKNKIRGFIDG